MPPISGWLHQVVHTGLREGGIACLPHSPISCRPYDFADRQLILEHVDHEIGYIRPRDFEPETRQMAPGVPVVGYSLITR
jgi:hypothetical protein